MVLQVLESSLIPVEKCIIWGGRAVHKLMKTFVEIWNIFLTIKQGCGTCMWQWLKKLLKMRSRCILLKSMGDHKNILQVLKIVHNKIMTINNVNWCTYREWEMYRAFQTAMVIHKPDVVFVLGEFLIRFGNLNHKIPAVLIPGWSLKSPLAHAFYIYFPFRNYILHIRLWWWIYSVIMLCLLPVSYTISNRQLFCL